MSSPSSSTEAEERFEQAANERIAEEKKYGELLTALDQTCQYELPHEMQSRYAELKETLNRAWDIAPQAFSAASAEDRIFWNEVARATVEYMKPFVAQQREFNSLLVHFVNEFTGSVHESLAKMRQFHQLQILFFQRLIPLIDSKFREMGSYERLFLERVRDYADLLFQELDRKIETVQSDVEAMSTLQTSVRALQHFANTWRAAAAQKPATTSDQHAQSPMAQSGASGYAAELSQEPQYFHFQEDLRGTRAEIKDKFRKYVEHFRNLPEGLVLDLGCGRGEFLELMKENRVNAAGVDLNEQMVQQCIDLGLHVRSGDLLHYLRNHEPETVSGIFSAQVAEHLSPEYLLQFLEVAYSRLRPGGVILIETVNIASAFAFLHVYSKDLSHCTPLHPDTLRFMMAAAGFQNPSVIYNSPVPKLDKMQLMENSNGDQAGLFNENMMKLNQLLYDDLEYAILAKK